VEPLSVNVAVWPTPPLFVNDIVPSVIVPMVFVLVVCVAPPKDRFQVPDVVGIVLQLDEVDQLPEPPPPVHVALPIGAAKEGLTPAPNDWTPTIAATKRQLRIIRDNGFIRLTTAVEGPGRRVFCEAVSYSAHPKSQNRGYLGIAAIEPKSWMSTGYMSAKASRQQTGVRFSENFLSFTESPSEIRSVGGAFREFSRDFVRLGDKYGQVWKKNSGSPT
jgi:hypothetical protein